MQRPTVLLACALLAGCLGGDEDAAPDPGDDATPDPARADLPEWGIGDRWVYRVQTPELGTHDIPLILYKTDVEHYWLGAPSRREAELHAVYNHVPILGRIHIDNLAPHENGTHAHMYDFPLFDGKGWSGPLYGYAFSFEAQASDRVSSPAGLKPGFVVEGEGPRARLEVTYVPEYRWFTELHLRNAAGKDLLQTELLDFDRGQHGPYHFIRASDLAQADLVGTNPAPQRTGFDVQSDQTHILIGIRGTADGSALLRILDPDGREVWQKSFGPVAQTRLTEAMIERAAVTRPGAWVLEASSVSRTDLDIRIAGIRQEDTGSV